VSDLFYLYYRMTSLGLQLWQEQAQQTAAVQGLAVSLRDMLDFANLARDIGKIEKGKDVIKEMCTVIEDAATFIKKYMDTNSLGRRLIIFDYLRMITCIQRTSWAYSSL
jgi:hypothetical protein